MRQFEQVPQNTQSIEEYKNILINQAEIETVSNLKTILQNIAHAFEIASTTDDRSEFNACLNNIINYENYLGEKYRDTAEERYYIKTVNEVIEYLKSL